MKKRVEIIAIVVYILFLILYVYALLNYNKETTPFDEVHQQIHDERMIQ